MPIQRGELGSNNNKNGPLKAEKCWRTKIQVIVFVHHFFICVLYEYQPSLSSSSSSSSQILLCAGMNQQLLNVVPGIRTSCRAKSWEVEVATRCFFFKHLFVLVLGLESKKIRSVCFCAVFGTCYFGAKVRKEQRKGACCIKKSFFIKRSDLELPPKEMAVDVKKLGGDTEKNNDIKDINDCWSEKRNLS